jgi:hypothetical protein
VLLFRQADFYTPPASVPSPATLSVTVTNMFFFIAVMFSGIVLYSLYQKRDVRASLKVPFVSFTFEAKDRRDDPKSLQKLE